MTQSATPTSAPGDTLPVKGTVRAASASPEAWIGRVLGGRYQVERLLGRGGMGLVFEARHVAVGRRVAVKLLRPEFARSEEAIARFHREARAAAEAEPWKKSLRLSPPVRDRASSSCLMRGLRIARQ